MREDDLSKEASLELPVGHLLVIWDVLANHLSGSALKYEFTEEQKRAVWGLEDLCEKELINKGYSTRPEKDWDQLMLKATEFVKTISVDCID